MGAIEVAGFKPGVLDASVDLSAKQFHAVKVGAADHEATISGDGDLSLGILQNDPIAGEAAEIEMDGISKAVIGASVSRGDKLAANAAGKLITAASAKHVVAIALEAGGADGEKISVKVIGSSGQLLA